MTTASVAVLARFGQRSRAHPTRTAVIAVVVVAVVATGAWWLLHRTSSSATTTAAATTRLVTVGAGTLDESVSSTGTVAPAQQSNVSFASSGRVTSVRVSLGQRVAAGDVLATIDSASLAASLAQAEAQLANDQAKVSSDQATTTTTSTQLAADQASVTSAENQVTSGRTALAGATMRSPIAGVVAAVNLTAGQQLSGSSGSSAASGSGSGAGTSGSGASGSGGSSDSGAGNSGSGGSGSGSSGSTSSGSSSSGEIEVVGTSSWLVNATADATQLGQIAVGDQVQMVVDGMTSTVFGTVNSVGVLPSASSSVTAYPVVVKVTGSPSGLHIGAAATLSIIYHQLNNVITVPTLALHRTGTTTTVTVQTGTKQVSTPVAVGTTANGEVQITSGLKSGDEVVVTVPARTGTSGTTRTGTGGGGGFGGGGFGGGGTGTGGTR